MRVSSFTIIVSMFLGSSVQAVADAQGDQQTLYVETTSPIEVFNNGILFDWSNAKSLRPGLRTVFLPKVIRTAEKASESSSSGYSTYTIHLAEAKYMEESTISSDESKMELRPDQLDSLVPHGHFPVNCSVDVPYLKARGVDVKDVVVTKHSDRFPIESTMPPPEVADLLNIGDYLESVVSDKICSIRLQAISRTDVNILAVLADPKASTIGVKTLRVAESKGIIKPYEPIARPFIDYFSSPTTDIRTDDEVWFLASSAIHVDPDLEKHFSSVSEDSIIDFVFYLVKFVVDRIEGRPEIEFLKKDMSAAQPANDYLIVRKLEVKDYDL